MNIVTCIWVNDKLRCTTAPGYEFNNTGTHHLVITVPRASRDHNGTYACHLTGSSMDGFQPCDFIVNSGKVYRYIVDNLTVVIIVYDNTPLLTELEHGVNCQVSAL